LLNYFSQNELIVKRIHPVNQKLKI